MSPKSAADDTTAPEASEAVEAPVAKKYHVGASIDEADYLALEEYRWSHRLNKTEVLVEAIRFFCSHTAGKW